MNLVNENVNGTIGIQPTGAVCTAVGMGCKAALCTVGGIWVTKPVAQTLLAVAASAVGSLANF